MKTPSCLPVVMMLMLPLIQGLSSGCIDREREALLEMKKSFIDKSHCLSSWSGVNCCHWMGVECNGIGHVIQLKIPHPQLNAYGRCYINNDIPDESFTDGDGGWLGGEINPSLLNLEYLEQLDLSGNKLSGIIPSNIGSLKHLTHIDLSQNNFTGPIPTSIGLLSSLEWLDVSDNHLTGPIPTSIGQLSKLLQLDVSVNSLTGTVSELHFAKLANLLSLYMDSNKLTINVRHQWVPPFQLQLLSIQSCIVGPEFPSWLQTQTSLLLLNLSSSGISDTMPGWFEGSLSTIDILDLSKNEIRGKVPEFRNPISFVSLNSNKFEHLFKQFPPNVSFLDVSNNLLSGQFPPKWDGPNDTYTLTSFIFANNNLSGPIPGYLCSLEPSFVDLSSNQLSGQLNSCFGSIEALQVLDLSHNNLHGQIPSDFGYGSGGYPLFSLHLSHNRFHGKLPSTLQNFNNLMTLDFGRNSFTGFLPQWLPKLTHLKILSFQLNNFYGEIPETLCKLKHLQLLHLGQNNISGTIPPCFSNFTAMTTNDSHRDPLVIPGGYYLGFAALGRHEFQENLEVVVRGLNQRYTSSLPFLVSMDLSSNNIVGNIPPELMNLLGLKNLNISCNRLEGNIPMRISNLKNIESLDLSRNKLCGVIPSSLSGLTFLSHLNLSFNNLSGRIPTGNQLQTLEDPSIYIGNNQLCGKPLEQKCPSDVNESSEHTRVHSHKVEDDDSFRMWFYAGIGPGFVVGLLGFCSVLHFKSSWRHAFFLFFENGWNWLYVQIAVKTSLLQKKFQKCQTGTQTTQQLGRKPNSNHILCCFKCMQLAEHCRNRLERCTRCCLLTAGKFIVLYKFFPKIDRHHHIVVFILVSMFCVIFLSCSTEFAAAAPSPSPIPPQKLPG